MNISKVTMPVFTGKKETTDKAVESSEKKEPKKQYRNISNSERKFDQRAFVNAKRAMMGLKPL